MGRYETGLQLLQAGVISGYDSTPNVPSPNSCSSWGMDWTKPKSATA